MAQVSKTATMRRIIPLAGVKEAKTAVELLISNLEKQFGKGIVSRVDKKAGLDIPVIPTGIPQIDLEVIQAGGVPRGKIIEVYGPEAGGKTTLCLQIIAEAQKLGGQCGFVDAEHALSPKRAQQLGVDLKKLLVSQPDCGEQALEIVEEMVKSGAMSVVVIDSVAALVPRAELDGEMGDSYMGLQARLMSQALRKLVAVTEQSQTVVIFINQVREKIGVMFGNPETTTGGRALKFYASLRLDVRRIGAIKEGENVIGNRTRVRGAKNRVGSPFQEAEVDLLFTVGFDKVGSWVDMAVERKIIDKSGAWFSYMDERLGQGRNNVVAMLRGNEDLFTSIQQAVKLAIKTADVTTVTDTVTEEIEVEP